MNEEKFTCPVCGEYSTSYNLQFDQAGNCKDCLFEQEPNFTGGFWENELFPQTEVIHIVKKGYKKE